MAEDRKFEELRVLYAACVSEISSFKLQQWRVTNYALLLNAALVSIAALFRSLTQIEYLFLIVGAGTVLWMGWHLIGVLDDSIQTRRSRLALTRRTFTDEFKDAWRGGKTEAEAPDDPEQKLTLRWLFRYILAIACIVTCWLLIRYASATPAALQQ